MTAKKILIVEDEPKLASIHSDYLNASGFETKIVGDGDMVIDALFGDDLDNTGNSAKFDLVILDVMLPGIDGMELCRHIRDRSDVPIIFITARIEENDRLLGLGLGADDYICKPFSPREVVARVLNILRRTSPKTEAANSDAIICNHDLFEAAINGHKIDLTPSEFQLFSFMVENSGKVLSREKLLDVIHEDFRDTTDRTIDSHIKNIRKKISKASTNHAKLISSVYGVGYKFEI